VVITGRGGLLDIFWEALKDCEQGQKYQINMVTHQTNVCSNSSQCMKTMISNNCEVILLTKIVITPHMCKSPDKFSVDK